MRSPHSAFRYSTLRATVSLAGDAGAAIAIASACAWIIESAALGLFLSFLVWLLGLIMSLALSQHIVHPTIQFAMADDKLNRGRALASALFDQLNTPAAQAILSWLWPKASRFRPA